MKFISTTSGKKDLLVGLLPRVKIIIIIIIIRFLYTSEQNNNNNNYRQERDLLLAAASLYYCPAVQLGGFPRHFSGARPKGYVTLTAFITLILDDSYCILVYCSFRY